MQPRKFGLFLHKFWFFFFFFIFLHSRPPTGRATLGQQGNKYTAAMFFAWQLSLYELGEVRLTFFFYMEIMPMNENNGCFRKKIGYAATSNVVLRSKILTLKEKGLYGVIQSWITLDTIVLTKEYLKQFCCEGDQAFENAWNGLKKNGYIKIHAFQSERGGYRYVYELLDTADLRDGVYLYRYDKSNRLTSTNKGPADEELVRQMEKEWEGTEHSVQPFDDHTPEKYPSGKDRNGKNHSSFNPTENRGCKLNLYNKTKNKPVNNPPISLWDDGVDEDTAVQVENELYESKSIPCDYAAQPEKMTYAIRFLTGYDFRQNKPYTKNGVPDEAKQNAFNEVVLCLAEMSTDLAETSYHGALVSYSQVIQRLNGICTDWEEGGLEEFVEQTLDDFMDATANNKVRNIHKYMKSVIWTSLISFRTKQDAEVNRLLHRKKQQADTINQGRTP